MFDPSSHLLFLVVAHYNEDTINFGGYPNGLELGLLKERISLLDYQGLNTSK